MPVHDWSRVKAGVFHHFHHSWIEELQRTLNNGLLPSDYYAMAEQRTGGFGPDVLTLELGPDDDNADVASSSGANDPADTGSGTGLVLAEPKTQVVEQGDLAFYRRKQNRVAVRHVSDDDVVAMIEVVSPGNKSARIGIGEFVEKAAALVGSGIHLLVADVHAPTAVCPDNIHAAIWRELQGESGESGETTEMPLVTVSYEATETPRAFVEPVRIGAALPPMPLFLKPGAHVSVPLEATYQAAFAALPLRWRRILTA